MEDKMENHEFNTDGFSTTQFTNDDLPEADALEQTFSAIANELGDLMLNTGLEKVLEQVSTRWTSQLHSLIGFHERTRDEQAQELKQLTTCQDGSEIQSNKLEELQASVQSADEVIEALEIMRDTMASAHQMMTGNPWTPQSGSKKSRGATTSAMLDARDYLDAKEKADAVRKAPQGFLIAVAGTVNFNDVNRAYKIFDSCLEKHPDMVLVHGGHSQGIDKIAVNWATMRKVDMVKCAPDFKTHGKSRAAFMRNDKIVNELRPKGVLVFIHPEDRHGVASNLLQKANEAGISTRRYLQSV
ncbi:DUF2493 domain-containing protein [Maricaulis virginensis]|jgi:roadblock/LC7 domain-containing protein|uniref:YspA cpYpsA-related SLOG domain-containing protein n=2 Tax=Alphaproteobacteria TaxID=28211 RepID=A0A9W6IQI5_9PROT|nr:DUF2493 domain-containing protein [Maricaulis virginensis]GLK53510.1 hypothetical protein GCM10017621_30180 [Maricaulis virginensis]